MKNVPTQMIATLVLAGLLWSSVSRVEASESAFTGLKALPAAFVVSALKKGSDLESANEETRSPRWPGTSKRIVTVLTTV